MRKSSFWAEDVWVVVLLALAFCLRVENVVSRGGHPLTGDEGWYEAVGFLLSEGKGDLLYRNFFRPPLYPLFIALVYWGWSQAPLTVLGVQALLGTATCGLVYLIGARMGGKAVGIIGLGLTAFFISLIQATSLFLTETLLTFLMTLGIYLLLRLERGRRWQTALALGGVIALATLTKASTMILPLFVIGGILFLRSWPGSRRLWVSFALLLAFGLTLLPWNVRNFIRYGEWVPIATNGGITFYSSYRPPEGKFFGFLAQDETTEYAERTFSSELEKSRFLFREGWRFIRENPRQLPRLELLKTAFLWVPFDWEILGKGRLNVSYTFLLPFILWGMVKPLKGIQGLWVLYLPILYLQLVSLIFYGSPRFRLPFEPILILFGTFGLIRFFSLFSKKWIPSACVAGWLGVLWILLLHSDQFRFRMSHLAVQMGLW